MRALVTGATGYIGGRLVPELLAAGHDVRCLARTPAKLADFKARVRAYGGSGSSSNGNGGAGTIYLKTAGRALTSSNYGTLIVDNSGVPNQAPGGRSTLVSFAGTVQTATDGHNYTVLPSNPALLNANYTHRYQGSLLRLGVGALDPNATPNNWADCLRKQG